MTAQQPIPIDPAAISAAWMHEALTLAGVAGEARVVDVAFAGFIGTGQMGRNARYSLTWDDPSGRPASVVGKFPAEDPVARASGFNGAYNKEMLFYRELAGTVDVRAPRCHVARLEEDQQNFVLLMEDMAGSAQGDQMRGLNVNEAALAVEQAVALHAPRWGDLSLVELMSRNPDENAAHLQEIYALCMEGTLARLGANLEREAIDLVRRFAPFVEPWAVAAGAPPTLVHMDFRPDNFLFGVSADAPPLAVVDWQTFTAGPGTHDLAYMIGGSFEAPERARVEHDLVAAYRDQLTARGIDYSFNACWRDYRVSSLWGVIMSVIATMLAAQTDRGDLMLTTMLRRHAQQAIDLDALQLVG